MSAQVKEPSTAQEAYALLERLSERVSEFARRDATGDDDAAIDAAWLRDELRDLLEAFADEPSNDNGSGTLSSVA